MKKKINEIMIVILCIITLVFTEGSTVFAATEHSIKTRDINDNKQVQEFMDNFFTSNMQKYKIPGAAVVVVKDGREVFKKGYGYSNLDKKIEVDPDKTLFPAASVSKLFTATAIMQLYEQGKLDINENVEKYIAPYKIENNYNEIITCANLLTHSSGVDEANEINGSTRNENDIKSQEYYFDNHKPKVVREPNTASRYSNQGYNLLGYVIEKVSGISYEEYINKNILEPLKMNNTLVRVKNDSIATGYEYNDGSFNEIPLAYQYTSGSSGINATPRDMENFMIGHLNNGEFYGVKILREETSKEMKKKQFTNNEALPGMGYGFIRSNRNGQEILKHEGGLPGFTTTMFLMPKENLGIYVATNSLSPLPFNIEDEFLNQFYPQESSKYNNIQANFNKDYSKYEGTYRSYDGISKSNIMKIGFLFDKTMDLRITDNRDGTLTLKEYTSAKEENITKLSEIKDGVFAREDGNGDFAFKLDSNRKVIYAFNDVSHNSFEKIKFYEGRTFNIVLFTLVILIFIINIGIGILMGLKRLFKRSIKENSKEIKKNILLNFIISLLNLSGFIGILILAAYMIVMNNSSNIYLLYILLGLLMFSTFLSVVGLINLIRSFRKEILRKIDKVHFTIVTVSNFIFVWLIYYFNFLGFKI